MARQACLFLGLYAACLGGCGDPVRDALLESLGPEEPGVSPGPRHRPGQPCLACHDEAGGDEPLLSVAGTIYREKGGTEALGDVTVKLVDSTGRTAEARSNCAGNFFLRPSQFQPVYPLWVTLVKGGESIDMDSPVYRDGSCQSCHTAPANPRSAGPVFMTDDPDVARALAAVPCTAKD